VPADQSPDDVIGRPMAHLSALKQVTGEAVYIDDMPRYDGSHIIMMMVMIRMLIEVLITVDNDVGDNE